MRGPKCGEVPAVVPVFPRAALGHHSMLIERIVPVTDTSPDTESTTTPSRVGAPIGRRTVLAGTAFAVPAIMVTVGSPAYAASGVVLAFDKSSYSGQGCSVISGVQVFAKDGANPKAGIAVSVSLSNSYSFANGGASYTGVTGSNGSLSLPDIHVPANGGSATASATSNGATASSASLSGTAAARQTVASYLNGGNLETADGIPGGSIPAFSAGFLAPDGNLINASTGTVMATNVESFGQIYSDSRQWAVPLKKKDGTFTYLENGTEKSATGVPSGSKPAYAAGFLSPDGRLINATDGTSQATDVDLFGTIFWDGAGDVWSVGFRKKDGTFTYLANGTEKAAIGVPSGSFPAYAAGFLAPDGRLVNASDGTSQATNVDQFGQIFWNGNAGWWAVPLKKKDGSYTYLENGVEKAAIGVPAGSTPTYSAGFISPSGDLVNGTTGTNQSTNVDSIGQIFWDDKAKAWSVPIKKRDGSFTFLRSESNITAAGIPANSTPAFAAGFLATDGRLMNGSTGTVMASNVDSFGQIYSDSGQWSVPLKKKDGSFSYLENGTEKAAIGVPSGSTPAYAAGFLAPDGRLVNATDGSSQATNVASVGQIFWDGGSNTWWVAFKKKDGSFTYLQNGTEKAAVGVPSGSAPAYAAGFLAPDGRLINATDGTSQASNVDSFGQIFWDGNSNAWSVPFRKKDGSCTYLVNGVEKSALGVPSGSRPAYSAGFLASDGRLINGADGSNQATDVVNFGQIFWNVSGKTWAVPFIQDKAAC